MREDRSIIEVFQLLERVIEPYRFPVNAPQRIVSPYFDAHGAADELGEIGRCRLAHRRADLTLILGHLVEIVVAGGNDLVIAGRIGVFITVGRLVVVDILQGDGRIGSDFEEIAPRVGKEYGMVACILHAGDDTQEAPIHLVLGRDVVSHVDDIVGVGRKEVVA